MAWGTPGSILGIDLPKWATMMWGEAGQEVGAALLSETLTYKYASSYLLAQPSALGSMGSCLGRHGGYASFSPENIHWDPYVIWPNTCSLKLKKAASVLRVWGKHTFEQCFDS